MSNVLGVRPPIALLAQRAHAVGALLLVDAAQSVAHAPTDVVRDGIDFLTFSGHKLYGPSGVGVLYGRAELLEAMDPMFGGGHMISHVARDHSEWAAPPARFEAGTPAIAQAIALGSAVDYVQGLGFDRVAAHEQRLLREARRQLQAIPGLTLYGPADDDSGAIVSFTMAGASAYDLAVCLDLHGVCVRHGHHCAMPLHDWLGVPATVRASFGVYNTLADVDRLSAALLDARRRLRLD
jgi:cysteine desulfurase/selenocysteine lyase